MKIVSQGRCQDAQVPLLRVRAAGPADRVQPPQGGGPSQRDQAARRLHRQVRSAADLAWIEKSGIFAGSVLLLLPQVYCILRKI